MTNSQRDINRNITQDHPAKLANFKTSFRYQALFDIIITGIHCHKLSPYKKNLQTALTTK